MFGRPLATPFEILARKLVYGYSPLLVIVGDETGIGKSMLGCFTAEQVFYRAFGKSWKPMEYDDSGNIKEENVFFRMTKFKNELFHSQQRIFIIEEAEIELGSDDWHSIENKWFARMKSTQRIKGNLYIVILPIFMQLARKHRRAVNYIFDVKGRGFFNAYSLKKRSAQILGDEISRFYLGSCKYPLPRCKNEYDVLDKENKALIEKEEGESLEEILSLKKAKRDRLKYRYTCPYCSFMWDTKTKPDQNKTCPTCKKMIYHDERTVETIRVLR